MEIKYPHVSVELIGTDGNAVSLIGLVAKQIRRKVSTEAATEFANEAFGSGSYDEVLQLIMRTVDVK